MWISFYFSLFFRTFVNLRRHAGYVAKNFPQDIAHYPRARLFLRLLAVIKQIRENPQADNYWLGNTLGKEHRAWRRAKDGLPDRYRLFFKFFSQNKEIFFVWLNDENTLRKEGAKTDCYAVFKRMLEKGQIPADRAGLLSNSLPPDARTKE